MNMHANAGGRPATNPTQQGRGGMSATDIMAMFAPAGAQQFQPYGGVPQPPQHTVQPQNPAQNPQDGGFQNANGGMAGQQGQQQSPQPGTGAQQQQQQQSPFEAFAGMFKVDDKTVNPVDALANPVFAMDAEKLKQHVAKMNFAGNIDPQQMQAILQGDASALSTVLNSVAQSTFQQMSQFMQQAMESGFNTYNGRLSSALPVQMRQFASQQEVAKELPFARDAGVAPLVEALQAQFLRSNPNMSPTELAGKVKQFMQTIASQMQNQQQQPARDPFTGAPVQPQQPQGGQDWDDFFSM